MNIREFSKGLGVQFNHNCNAEFEIGKNLSGTYMKIGSRLFDFLSSLNIKKIDDYFYSADLFYDYNYKDGEEYFKHYLDGVGLCSSAVKGNLYGRNYDWYYDNACEFFIRTEAKNGRHASWGIASLSKVTPEMVDNKIYSDAFKALPFAVLDGRNDHDVACSINIVHSDKGYTSGTNPGKPNLCELSIIRFMLDYADSAVDGINKLNQMNIWSALKDIEEEIHMSVKDPAGCYIVEFIHNSMHVMSNIPDDGFDDIPNDLPIMTNFYLSEWDGDTTTGFYTEGGMDPSTSTLEPYSQGVERYDILRAGYDSVANYQDMIDLMKLVTYTYAYDRDRNPFWYSELVANYEKYGDLNIFKNKEEFKPVVDIFILQYEERSRDSGKTWLTVHTSTYDLDNKKLYVTVQENGTVHEFDIQ